MKQLSILVLVVLFSAGCATSTIESRKKERYSAYAELSSEQRAVVDAGQIKIGMPMDAVYIAWGKPHQILAAESPAVAHTIWLYSDTYLQGYSYWGYHGYYGHYRPYYYGPTLRYDYVPVGFVKAEVIFEKDLVKQWRTLPAPP